jgi:hypothetical protein
MTNTVAKTYRLPAPLYKLILAEVDKSGMSEADFVRLVLRHYFEHRQEAARIDALESRLIKAVEGEAQRIASLIEQVIALAQPE